MHFDPYIWILSVNYNTLMIKLKCIQELQLNTIRILDYVKTYKEYMFVLM